MLEALKLGQAFVSEVCCIFLNTELLELPFLVDGRLSQVDEHDRSALLYLIVICGGSSVDEGAGWG